MTLWIMFILFDAVTSAPHSTSDGKINALVSYFIRYFLHVIATGAISSSCRRMQHFSAGAVDVKVTFSSAPQCYFTSE